jgi:hypothetical protein
MKTFTLGCNELLMIQQKALFLFFLFFFYFFYAALLTLFDICYNWGLV